MKRRKPSTKRYKVSSKEATSLILRYIRKRITEQIKAVAGIILYLLLFQSIVLGIPILDASVIALGMGLVIVGLSFFMEGLLLGIMPMGEEIGIWLPQKAKTVTILTIAFILGIGATLAEPAIGVLKAAGSSVLAWQAPLLFLFLNKYSSQLVAAVGIGVGFALVLGMYRFLKGHSLKPYIYVMISLLLGLSFFAYLNPNLRSLMGLAWDCGGVTTGPVTVPLVLALGIGVSHVASRGGSKTEGGFGVVTMASLVPVIAVLSLGILYSFSVPSPCTDVQFFSPDNEQSSYLFEDEQAMRDYALRTASFDAQVQAFGSDKAALMSYVTILSEDEERIKEVFGSQKAFNIWIVKNGSDALKSRHEALFTGDPDAIVQDNGKLQEMNVGEYLKRNIMNAIRAIVPLSLFLMGVLYLVLRERLGRADEIFLGLAFAIIGMAIFGGGIELGLSKVGDQVGSNLPVSFSVMKSPEAQKLIRNFDESVINTAISPDGSHHGFFYYEDEGKVVSVPYEPENHDPDNEVYRYVPQRGPLFGKGDYTITGLLVVLLFAFFLGFSATIAEPALNALGITVEDITVGAFRKTTLIRAVAIGVGCGITLGLVKIIWNLPLFWLLSPLYLLLLVFTYFSTEEFVNIGWDSAGVTTGPITVPLVLSMGLGIGGRVGAMEGFGILALASACPIISVLGMGLFVNYKRKVYLREFEPETYKDPTEELVL